MLRPGAGRSREEVARSQRERLFAAMVAVVSERGYEATTVADLVALSGVSRSAFYDHFSDKRECFLATVDAIVQLTFGGVLERFSGEGSWEVRAREALVSFAQLIAEQPAAARMCFVDIYAAGPPAIERVDNTLDGAEALVRQAREGIPGQEGMPREIVRALLGGTRKIIHKRLYRGTERELVDLVPQLWELGFNFAPPPEPLRRGRRRQSTIPWREGDPQGGSTMRAIASVVAERGYPDTTITEIAERASISLTTFYEEFGSKEDAVIAALDSGGAFMLAATLPVARRASYWAEGVRTGLTAMLGFLAANPEFAQLAIAEAYAAGPKVLAVRDRVIDELQALVQPGYAHAPGTAPIASEFIGGAIFAALYDQMRASGPETLPRAAPLCTYLALTPFIGAAEATAVANGKRRNAGRAPKAGEPAEPELADLS